MNTVLQTKRLKARHLSPADAPRIAELMADKDIPWFLARAPWPYTLGDAETWITSATEQWETGTGASFAICKNDELIGSCGMSLVDETQAVWEIGYWIGKPYWGQGYASEIGHGLIDWAKTERGITQFIAGHSIENPASGAVLKKIGFSEAGRATHFVVSRDCDAETIRYVLGAPAKLAIAAAALYKRPDT